MGENDQRILNRELVCVLFPGVVKNEEKAIHNLGGIKSISQVHCQPMKKRLGLSFQPENPFVKKIFADEKKTAGVLLKVKVKKVKNGNEVKRQIVSTDVIGRVSKIYAFESMCDFQFLPVHKNEATGQTQCSLEDLLPTGLDNLDFFSDHSSPYYIVPASFTRTDRPIRYSYTGKKYPGVANSLDNVDEFHNKNRSERGLSKVHWQFTLTGDIPSQPKPVYVKNLNLKMMHNPNVKSYYEIVKKCFDERPMWTLNLLRYKTKIRLNYLKSIVFCLSVLMSDGPWKKTWVRYGYDPRKDRGSRIYQTLDFRLRHTAGVYSMVMTRDQVCHYKKADRVRSIRKKNNSEPLAMEEVPEGTCYVRPGLVPAQRQIFYQLCDVELPEVQEIINKEPPPELECHERYGWLPGNSLWVCRDHIFNCIKETLLATSNANLKLEEVNSDDDDNSDDGDGDGDGDVGGDVDDDPDDTINEDESL